jgi:hypothetical protein
LPPSSSWTLTSSSSAQLPIPIIIQLSLATGAVAVAVVVRAATQWYPNFHYRRSYWIATGRRALRSCDWSGRCTLPSALTPILSPLRGHQWVCTLLSIRVALTIAFDNSKRERRLRRVHAPVHAGSLHSSQESEQQPICRHCVDFSLVDAAVVFLLERGFLAQQSRKERRREESLSLSLGPLVLPSAEGGTTQVREAR